MIKYYGACLLAVALPATGRAAELSYDAAIQRAADSAPARDAARYGIDAARSAARAAGALPDPSLVIGVDNFPVSGPPAFNLRQDEMTMGRIGIEQDVPNLAKRRAARVVAAADIQMAEAGGSVELRKARLGAALAWIDLAYTGQRLTVIDTILKSLRPLVGTVKASVTSGSARPAQTLAIAKTIADLEDRRDELQSQVERARATLTRWTGDPSPRVTGPLPSIAVVPELLRASLDVHPDIVSAEATTQRADANLAVARADKHPDWGFDVAYQRRDPRYGDMVSAGVKIGLPLFARTRQDPLIAARTSEAAKAAAEREDARRALAEALDAGLADHTMHHAQWMRARDTLLPLARQRVDLETASYSASRAGVIDVVEAQTMLADAELTVLEREAEVARDAARLTMTYGRDGR